MEGTGFYFYNIAMCLRTCISLSLSLFLCVGRLSSRKDVDYRESQLQNVWTLFLSPLFSINLVFVQVKYLFWMWSDWIFSKIICVMLVWAIIPCCACTSCFLFSLLLLFFLPLFCLCFSLSLFPSLSFPPLHRLSNHPALSGTVPLWGKLSRADLDLPRFSRN